MKHKKWIRHRTRARKYKKLYYYQRHNVGKKKMPTIGKMERKAFARLSEVPREYGGKMDFGRNKRLERFTANVGRKFEVMVPDFEVTWHTHPPHTQRVAPTPRDIASLTGKANQAGIIFRGDEAFIYAKKDKAKKMFKKLRQYDKTLGHYKKKYKRLGQTMPAHISATISLTKPKLRIMTKKRWHAVANRKIANMLRKDGFYVKHIKRGNVSIKIPVKVKEWRRR